MKRFLNVLSTFLQKFPNNLAIIGIMLYRVILSPSVGIFRFIPGYPKPSCVFYPTCSEYGVMCFKQYSFIQALKKTLHRISRCHPSTDPSVDMP